PACRATMPLLRCLFTLALLVTANPLSAQEASILPGATRVIDAERYPSIQAAIDAVGQAGGIVRLPPGEFKITQPLRIQRGDTRLEGSGTATNIINANEAGQPALLLAHVDGQKVKRADRLWRVNVANLRITGNDKSGAGIQAIQIEEI